MTRLAWPALLLAALTGPPLAAEIASDRPSHLPLGNGLDANMRPEDAVRQRLGPARDQKQSQDQLDDLAERKNIRELAQKLLGDEKFLESLKGMSREDAEKLLGKVGVEGGIGADPELQRLLKQGLAGGALSDDEKKLAERWREKLTQSGVVEPPEGVGPGPGRMAPPPPPFPQPPQPRPKPPGASPPPAQPPWRPLDDSRAPDWLKGRLDGWSKSVAKWAESPGGKSWADVFKDFSRRYEANRGVPPAVAERAQSLTRHLPRLSNYLPRNVRPPRLLTPRLPQVSAPSQGSVNSAGKALVWIVVLGVIALLLWRVGGLAERLKQARAAGWRLGPWPVRPEDVSTRGELVRAYEYLALLLLGRDARTRNHLDVAGRIGEQPSFDPDRRRDAAELLARLYEQARYAPGDEPLAAEELHRARRELCYLAGVTAA